MSDVPGVFWLGVLSVLGAIFTRFGIRDYPGVPRPSTFLEFAVVCFLMAIVLILGQILWVMKAQCAPKDEPPAETPEP